MHFSHRAILTALAVLLFVSGTALSVVLAQGFGLGMGMDDSRRGAAGAPQVLTFWLWNTNGFITWNTNGKVKCNGC